jgi:sulfite oxidase
MPGPCPSRASKPAQLSLAELKTLGIDTVATVLQCSGNGRGFFPSKPSGTPWTVGAAGCVVWSGVPLRNVVAALGGLVDGMAYVTGTGGEKLPEGVDPLTVLVERSVPLKALDDAILAWEMNGEPLSLAHGGPLRLVVPGYQGVNNIKYVKRLAFTPHSRRRASCSTATACRHPAPRPARTSPRCGR